MIPSAFLHERLDELDARATARERAPALRAVVVVGALAGLQIAAFGAAWGVVWHEFVGRERAFAPPQLVFYVGIGIATLLLGVDALVERRALTRGIALAGCGVLAIVVAAPFDALWHAWYGVDSAVGEPFEVMGLCGLGIASLGLAYASAELARSRRAFAFGVSFALASGCTLAAALAEPTLRATIGVERIPFGSFLPAALICAFGMTACALVGVGYARDSRAALWVFGLYLLCAALVETLAPAATRAYVAHAGIPYRVPGFEPPNGVHFVALSLALVPAALILALARERASQPLPAALAAVFVALATSIRVSAAQATVLPIPHANPPLPLEAIPLALPATVALAALGGALLAAPARGLGRLLRAP